MYARTGGFPDDVSSGLRVLAVYIYIYLVPGGGVGVGGAETLSLA